MNLRNYILPIVTALGIVLSTILISGVVMHRGLNTGELQTAYLVSIPLQFLGAALLFRGKYSGVTQSLFAFGITGTGSLIGFVSLKILGN